MTTRRTLLLGALAGLGLVRCIPDPENPPPAEYLEGSLREVMDLGFDEVRLQLAQEDLALLFVRKHPIAVLPDAGRGPAGFSEDYPFKLGLQLWGASLDGGLDADLTETTDAGARRASFTRDVLNDPRKSFPPCRLGSLHLDATPLPGGTVGGNFHVTFVNGIEPASGRVVFDKNFTAKVVQ